MAETMVTTEVKKATHGVTWSVGLMMYETLDPFYGLIDFMGNVPKEAPIQASAIYSMLRLALEGAETRVEDGRGMYDRYAVEFFAHSFNKRAADLVTGPPASSFVCPHCLSEGDLTWDELDDIYHCSRCKKSYDGIEGLMSSFVEVVRENQ